MSAGSQEHESACVTHAVSWMTLCETREAPLAPWEPDVLAVRIRCSANIRCVSRFPGGSFLRAAVTHKEVLVDLFDPEDLRSESACRTAVRRVLRTLLERAEYYGYRAADGGDALVPPGLVDTILAVAAAVADTRDGADLRNISYRCDVSMEVDMKNVYSEAKAIVLLCSGAAGPRRRDVGGELCPICMEKLAPDDAMSLPGCSHVFHRGCILEWLHRAPTCLSCRHDMTQHLPHQCRACDKWEPWVDSLGAAV
ncbi:uncharacterized protein LOC104584166 [Brachypodium distachyon]|uniref:uncharacterized protein LOC104584166 n=1 Tax=Brachypodium distachyon TaxID=15368 RepID=UPI00052FDCAC|nr:uncharacterized protein LOC104584166 [Brachypodium distachyon]|eukprot:XP_010236624.1 uncharacterized protein LOC104584166 [Brachypodium distachyon]